MGDFRVITDGSGDIPADVIKSRDITVINFYVLLGSGEYLEQNVDIGDDEFYEWMVAHPGVYPKSSTPSTQDYLKLFTQVAQAGEKAIVLCITEKFSNSYQTACIALDLLREDYPDAEITVINSMVNTVLVMGSIYVLFAQQYAAAKDVAREAVFGLVMTTVAFNGIPEALAAAVLVAAIGKALLRVTRTQLQTA